MSTVTLLLTLLTVFANIVLGGHTVARPGGAKDIIITSENTLNTTNVKLPGLRYASSTNGQLTLSFTNNLASNYLTAYVTGLDNNGKLVMLQPDGQWYYPVASTSAVPQPVVANVSIPMGGKGTTTSIVLPGYITAGRVWFADGTLQFFTVPGAAGPALVQPSAAHPSDPHAATNWGFVELTNIASGIYANISYVDFVGLPLGMTLVGSAGTSSALGVTSDAVTGLCSKLTAKAATSGAPWDQLCVADTNGDILRVISPSLYISNKPAAFSKQFTKYVDQVWQRFSTTPLIIDTQSSPGIINCTVTSGKMTCGGESLIYQKPSAADIFGCNTGPFAVQGSAINLAVVPRLCAAFNRATLLLPKGTSQPFVNTVNYYLNAPSNFYSKFVKSYEPDGRGYAFPYDDVTPTAGVDYSGLLADPNPSTLTITIGGPSAPVASAAVAAKKNAAAVKVKAQSRIMRGRL